MPHLTLTKDAKQRLKEIRPYINFNYDLRKPLSKTQKRKIAVYYNELAALFSRPYQIYRPKGGRASKKLQAFAQHDRYLPGLKVAVIPNNGEEMKITKNKKGEYKAKGEFVEFSTVPLDTDELLENPEAHVNERIEQYPAKQYTIQAGRYEIPIPHLPNTVGKAVAKLCAKYSDESDNHYFGNWLHGLIRYKFHNQEQIKDYLVTKHAAIKRDKKERLSIRRLKEKIADLQFTLKNINPEGLYAARIKKRIKRLEQHLAELYQRAR